MTLVFGEKNEKLGVIGFPHGCESMVTGRFDGPVGKVASAEDQTQCFNLLAGVSRSHGFYLFNMDNYVMWGQAFPQVQPILPLKMLITLPDWDYPRKAAFISFQTNTQFKDYVSTFLRGHTKSLQTVSPNDTLSAVSSLPSRRSTY